MKKIKELIAKYPKLHLDKVAHFITGALIALVILLITGAPMAGFAGAFIVGLIKEFRDHQKYGAGGIHTWLDWFATMAGAMLVEWIL